MTPFVDFITLLLANMAGGLFILALYLLFGLNNPSAKGWAAAFAVVGLVAFVAGMFMTLTWPVKNTPQFKAVWANMAYGETSVLLGVLFLGAALAVAKGWDLVPLAVYGVVAGGVGVLLGVGLLVQLPKMPVVAGIGFILTGGAGVLLLPAVLCRRTLLLRLLVSAALAAAGVIWAITTVQAYWGHLARYAT